MPTTLQESHKSLHIEVYDKEKPVTAAALTPLSIAMSTMSYRSADDTVAVWEGKAYVPSIERCIRDLGRDKVEAMLKLYLVRLNVATNAARPLTEDVIEAMVPVILDHITNDLDVTINLADLRIVMDRALSGYYGKAYGGFGSQDVCGWFDQYNREKMQAIDAVERRRKDAELHGIRSNGRKHEVARMRDVMHAYNLDKFKKQTNTEQP